MKNQEQIPFCEYLWLRLNKKPYPGWYQIFKVKTKYVTAFCEMRMSWGFGVEIHQECSPYSARLQADFWKVNLTICFGKNKLAFLDKKP